MNTHIPPRGKTRNHDDEIANLRAELESMPDDTTVYPCVIETGGIGNLWTARNDEDFAYFDAGLARFLGWALIALVAAGGWLIGGLL